MARNAQNGLALLELIILLIVVVAATLGGNVLMTQFYRMQAEEQALAAFAALGTPVPLMANVGGDTLVMLPVATVQDNLLNMAKILAESAAGDDEFCTVAYTLPKIDCLSPDPKPSIYAWARSNGTKGVAAGPDDLVDNCDLSNPDGASSLAESIRITMDRAPNCKGLQAMMGAISKETNLSQAAPASARAVIAPDGGGSYGGSGSGGSGSVGSGMSIGSMSSGGGGFSGF
jgi:uncharacterized membrane protein YgcG